MFVKVHSAHIHPSVYPRDLGRPQYSAAPRISCRIGNSNIFIFLLKFKNEINACIIICHVYYKLLGQDKYFHMTI